MGKRRRNKIKQALSLDAARAALEAQKRFATPPEPEPLPEPEPELETPEAELKRGRGRPRKEPVTPIPVAPASLPPPPRDRAGRSISPLWDALRQQYSESVVRLVDDLVTRGSVKLDDLVHIEIAEHEALKEWGRNPATGDRVKERVISMALQSRKQLARLLEIRGAIGSANDILVAVPVGVNLYKVKPTTGHDPLAEAREEDFPEHLRTAK